MWSLNSQPHGYQDWDSVDEIHKQIGYFRLWYFYRMSIHLNTKVLTTRIILTETKRPPATTWSQWLKTHYSDIKLTIWYRTSKLKNQISEAGFLSVFSICFKLFLRLAAKHLISFKYLLKVYLIDITSSVKHNPPYVHRFI